MTQMKSFPRGGVFPPLTAELSRREPVTNAAVPPRAVIPMRQHAGEPAECIVHPGDMVREGMVIGKAFGRHCAHVHASIPGRVVEISQAADAFGGVCQAVVIDLEGEFDRSGRCTTVRAWENLPRFDLLGLVQAAGIVEMGGSREPTHLRLAVLPGTAARLLVANGVESDPSLSCVSALLREKPRQIVEGIRIAMKILGPSAGAVLAVGGADVRLVPAFERAVDSAGADIDIAVVSSRYPQADGQLLAAALEGRGTGRGSTARRSARQPALGKDVMLGVATLLAVYEAVVLDKPLIEGIVTVGGSPVCRPRNLKARFGTPIAELIDECGRLGEAPGAVVLGGSMTGRAVDWLQVPFTKGTTGVLVLSQREARVPPAHACISCGRCLDACPWGLEPTRLFKLLEHGRVEEALSEGLGECTVCGCCAYVCPSRIPLAKGLDRGQRGRPLGGI